MTSPFKSLATSSGINWESLKGSLLIFDVAAVEHDMPTVHGVVATVVRATVTVVDGDKKGEVIADTFIFPKVLASKLASEVGSKVLGRLAQGEAMPGKNAAWVLTQFTEEDHKAALAYLPAEDDEAF